MTERIRTGDGNTRATLLHVTECSSGGVTRAVELAIRAAPEIEHVVLAPTGAIRTDDLKVRHFPLPDGIWARIREVRRVVGQVGASAVHAHSSRAGGYARMANLDVPVMYQPHCYAFSDVTKPNLVRAAYWLAERLMTRRTSAVLALTPHEERQARRLGVRTVHQVVNTPTIGRAGRSTGWTATARVRTVAMIGRIAPQKDPSLFAAVAERFRNDPTVRFIWLGGVSDTAPYAAGIRVLRDAGVEVSGWIDDAQLAERLNRVDLYLHSAAYEGFPLSLLDACAMGVPAIVRDIPALAECGLPTFGTPREAARLVTTFLEDEHAYRSLAKKAEELASRRNAQAHNESIMRAYLESVV